MSWAKLQNGSDIRGVAIGGPTTPANLNANVVRAISAAFVTWTSEQCGKSNNDVRIAVGMDSRISGPDMTEWFVGGATAAGATVVQFGMASTPAMFMSCVTEGHMYDAACFLTASHLPSDRNGLKFFTAKGGLDKKDITRLLEMAEAISNGAGVADAVVGKVEKADFMAVYCQQLVDAIRKGANAKDNYDTPLAGFHIVVDAGNGAGGFFGGVLQTLGANIEGSQFLEPDGTFPNHAPNPEDQAAMASVRDAVLKSKADLGIIFDTDVDRAGCVSADGVEINRNRLIALASAIVLEEQPGSTIVTDSVTSDGLAEFIAKRGGKHHRFKRGYKNVIDEGIRLTTIGQPCFLAIETSGHGALQSNHWLDDGAYLIVKVLATMARMRPAPVTDLIKELREPVESIELRLTMPGVTDFKALGQSLIDHIGSAVKSDDAWQVAPDNHEGIRVNLKGVGWFLLRVSLHDPVLPLNVEADVAEGTRQILTSLLPVLKIGPPGVDITPISKRLEG